MARSTPGRTLPIPWENAANDRMDRRPETLHGAPHHMASERSNEMSLPHHAQSRFCRRSATPVVNHKWRTHECTSRTRMLVLRDGLLDRARAPGRDPRNPTTKETMMAWTQAICDDCWDKQHPTKPSPRQAVGPTERCAYCGASTNSGIYVRDDPAKVPYPTPDT